MWLGSRRHRTRRNAPAVGGDLCRARRSRTRRDGPRSHRCCLRLQRRHQELHRHLGRTNRRVRRAEVFEHALDTIVETDSFFCEGLIPGDGFNCTGAAHPGKDVKTSFETFDPVCSETEVTPRLKIQIVISDANGATAGPFRLRGPEACPKPKPAKPAVKPHGHKGKGGKKGGKHHRAAKTRAGR